jgi:hypothetical protein
MDMCAIKVFNQSINHLLEQGLAAEQGGGKHQCVGDEGAHRDAHYGHRHPPLARLGRGVSAVHVAMLMLLLMSESTSQVTSIIQIFKHKVCNATKSTVQSRFLSIWGHTYTCILREFLVLYEAQNLF